MTEEEIEDELVALCLKAIKVYESNGIAPSYSRRYLAEQLDMVIKRIYNNAK